MKLRNRFFAGLALCAFAACSNDDEPGGPENGQAASLSIEIVTPSTKATDNGTEAESKLSSIRVVLFTEAGQFVAQKDAEVTAGLADKTIYFDRSKGLKAGTSYQVIALANVPAAELPTTQTPGAYDALVSDLATATADNRFIMSGKVSSGALQAVTQDNSETTPNKVTVPVARIASKVILKSLTVDFSAEALAAGADSYTVKEVYLINGKKESKIYGGDHISSVYSASAAFMQGKSFTEPLFAGHDKDAEVLSGFYKALTTNNTIANAASSNDLFTSYLLANESTANATYLIINGTVNFMAASGTPAKDVFYAVLLKGDDTATAAGRVLRNTVYEIDATISGIKGGRDEAGFRVSISVDPWTVATLPV